MKNSNRIRFFLQMALL